METSSVYLGAFVCIIWVYAYILKVGLKECSGYFLLILVYFSMIYCMYCTCKGDKDTFPGDMGTFSASNFKIIQNREH